MYLSDLSTTQWFTNNATSYVPWVAGPPLAVGGPETMIPKPVTQGRGMFRVVNCWEGQRCWEHSIRAGINHSSVCDLIEGTLCTHWMGDQSGPTKLRCFTVPRLSIVVYHPLDGISCHCDSFAHTSQDCFGRQIINFASAPQQKGKVLSRKKIPTPEASLKVIKWSKEQNVSKP